MISDRLHWRYKSVTCWGQAGCTGVTKVSGVRSDRLHWCYKSVTRGVRQAALALQKRHDLQQIEHSLGHREAPFRRVTICVTKVSHVGLDRLPWRYKSVTRGVRQAALALQKCHAIGRRKAPVTAMLQCVNPCTTHT